MTVHCFHSTKKRTIPVESDAVRVSQRLVARTHKGEAYVPLEDGIQEAKNGKPEDICCTIKSQARESAWILKFRSATTVEKREGKGLAAKRVRVKGGRSRSLVFYLTKKTR